MAAPPSATAPPSQDGKPDPRAVEKDVPTVLPFEFKRAGYTMVKDLPESLRPWRNRPTAWANVTPPLSSVYH
ncbi:hypothetical protein E2C00_19915 [Streptomyces sp. WAC05374]|uniref:hypothetical protein n=1 Tax=Streptomyces sp. WAC05374 TaxID=2487420 RepID=UPI000F873B33|nr:hypothetical protein [Streptomyces sp. WAC05374]RST09355.1 hypothetical protein EF905_29500 [Streptomyces sp. WAC05374]TDF40201.1 hypothetical protein E2B92_25265 [Streptomyces sp. WAC05374]TDF53391.1 hypothetical protein E2C00_19915 [Streptomyces sp. WAC05374]TDF59238.1 hypothetical protein E2C02_05395 [Streptomyces sp. WAC05374]